MTAQTLADNCNNSNFIISVPQPVINNSLPPTFFFIQTFSYCLRLLCKSGL